MLISMNWIEDFVDLSGLDKIALIKRFTLATAEVEDIFVMGADVQGVVSARIESIENHPNSKKLHLLKVNTGKTVVDCVCGAPNVREGMIVAFATEGGKAGGMDIVKTKIAGFESCGMCCSEKELGISANHDGIMELDADTPLGVDVKELFAIDDTVFEVDNKSLTNRPDLWGHYGIAREFAAIADRPLRPVPVFDAKSIESLPEVDVKIEDERCYRYTSAIVTGISRKVSPMNMRIRLFYCGLRAINFLADLTNYVMLELGQPMHAFDYSVVQKVNVRRFENEFTFTTLDEVERKIDSETLMICSDDKPMAIAGIMGGLNSEIEDTTTSLLLESANFDGITTRKSTVRIGLRTDASMRYEKMLDPELTMTAALRYLNLLQEFDPNVKFESRISDVRTYSFPEIAIDFDKAFVDRYTGIDISNERIEKTLTALGFRLTRNGDAFHVDVPSWRRTKDVTIKADIIEEITRIYGYDNFEVRPSENVLYPIPETANRRDDFGVKTLLADRYGFHEVHSYLWSDSRKLAQIGIDVEDNVKIINSMSTDWTILRRNMTPTLLSMVQDNRRFADRFGIFEIARVVEGVKEDGQCNERKKLGIVVFDKVSGEKDAYLGVVDAVRTIGTVLKNEALTMVNETAEKPWQHPVNTAGVYLDGKKIGFVSVVHPSVVDKIDKKAAIICAEIDMDLFSAYAGTAVSYAEPSKFPGVEYDLSLLVGKDQPYAEIMAIVDAEKCPLLLGYRPVDEYRDASLGDKRSMTVRFTFGAFDRTLSGQEVQEQIDVLTARFTEAGIALKI